MASNSHFRSSLGEVVAFLTAGIMTAGNSQLSEPDRVIGRIMSRWKESKITQCM